MLRIGVCDDDKEFRQRLVQMIRIWSEHSGIPTELYPFDNGDELIAKNAAFRMDIILLDIVMPLLNGMDTARELRAQDTAVKIIFLTSSPEFALESYEVRAQDYLLKPITYDDFMGSCQKVFESYMQDDNYNPIKRDGFLVVKRDYKCVRIPIDDILFVDCDKDYIRFHLEGRPNIRTLGNLKQLEERLPREKFKRVHRSFLANMTKFDTVDQQHITYGDQSIPISETYFEFIKKYLEDHSL